MLKKIVPVSLILLFVSAAFMIGCQKRHCNKDPEKKMKYALSYLDRKLDLTDDQEAKIKNVMDEAYAKYKENKADNEKIHLEALDFLRSDKIDENAVSKLIAQKEAMWQEIRPFVVEKIVEVHGILTVEQRTKLADKIEDHHERCKEKE